MRSSRRTNRARERVGGLGAKPPDQSKSPPQRAVSRILSAFVRHSASLAGCASADFGGTIIPLGPASLTGSSSLPGGFGRAVRLPIWPCSVRGLACHLSCDKRGALLPHLFTLTRLRTRTFRSSCFGAAVCFLCHFPSGCPDRVLPGALPCGVRTFLATFRPRDRLSRYGGTEILAWQETLRDLAIDRARRSWGLSRRGRVVGRQRLDAQKAIGVD